jgi:hypothetical protein
LYPRFGPKVFVIMKSPRVARSASGSSPRNHGIRSWPGVGYYHMTAAGIVASLGGIAATMPLLRRITGPEVARNE